MCLKIRYNKKSCKFLEFLVHLNKALGQKPIASSAQARGNELRAHIGLVACGVTDVCAP